MILFWKMPAEDQCGNAVFRCSTDHISTDSAWKHEITGLHRFPRCQLVQNKMYHWCLKKCKQSPRDAHFRAVWDCGVRLDLTNHRSANFRHPLVVVCQENITHLTKKSTLTLQFWGTSSNPRMNIIVAVYDIALNNNQLTVLFHQMLHLASVVQLPGCHNQIL